MTLFPGLWKHTLCREYLKLPLTYTVEDSKYTKCIKHVLKNCCYTRFYDLSKQLKSFSCRFFFLHTKIS